MKFHERIFDWCIGIIAPILLWTLGNLNDRLASCCASFFGMSLRLLYPKGMKLICANIRVAFPEWTQAEVKAMAKKNMFHGMMVWVDFLRVLAHPERLDSFLNGVELPENMARCFVMCIPHLGNWELIAQRLAREFGECAAIATKFPYPRLNALLEKARTVNGLSIIPRQGAVRGMLSSLSRGVPVGILIDQNLSPKHGGVFVNFFDLPVPTSPLAAVAAIRKSLPIYGAACVREDNGKYRIVVKEIPIEEGEKDQVKVTQAIISSNEAMVRRWPEQYTWLYKRWVYTTLELDEERRKRLPYYAREAKYSETGKNREAVQ